MSDNNQKLSALSPEKRALLESRLLRRATMNKQTATVLQKNSAEPEISFAQQSLWFMDRLQPGSSFYIIPQMVRLRGLLDFEALQKSFHAIIERHEVLRTQFIAVDGHPKPRLDQRLQFDLPLIDLSQLSEEERREKVSQLIHEEGQRPFNLENDLMLRATVLRLGQSENILLLSVHHIASDHWSFAILYRELMALYEGFCSGTATTLPSLKNQYSDFARKERGFMTSDAFKTQLAFWRKQLSGDLPELDLPTDHARPATPNFRGARKFIPLSSDVTARLKNFSQSEGSTLFVTLLAAFQTLLHRYSDQTDLIIGSPFGARNDLDDEHLIGYFLNTLVLRTDLSGDPTFRELMQRSRRVTLDAFTNGRIPFEKLVEELRLPHRTDRNPLFQIIFQFQPTVLPSIDLHGAKGEPINIETGTSKMDLVFTIAESEKGLIGDLEYNTDLFDEGTIERMLEHYATLLESIIENPGETISRLKLSRESKRQQILAWNKTTTNYPREKTVAQLFEEQVAQTPDATALVFGEQQLTYRELNQRANQLAQHLRECGVGPDVLVGIALERSFELIISLLAVLKAGGAFVPLESSYPEERLKFMLEDTGASLLISDKPFSFSDARKIHPRDFENLDVQRSMFDVQCFPAPENLAYVMYTSGSTGKPKGVAVPHRAIVRLVKETNFMKFSSEDVFLQFAPVSFDASTLEIWGSLLNGAKLVIHPPDFPSLEELGKTLTQHEITTLWLTAGLFHQMIEHQIESLRGVRQLLAGGDVLSVPHVRSVLKQLPECQLINGYGPTENTTFTCCYSVPKNWSGRSVPIGKPISNTQVYILDKNLEPTPIDVPGELFISGDGLARGYLNRPELNAEKFIENPPHLIGNQAKQRLYRTGDKVRYRADGNIEFLGRFDNQVKIRGFRIELGEIESVLAEHALVRESVVVAQENSNQEKFIAAYVVLNDASDKAIQQLQTFLKQKLPGYMVPTAIVPQAQLPLTPNGKIDRRQLPDPGVISKADLIPPRNETEIKLFDIWREVLGRNHFGVRDNFFELGGHSLMATQVASRIIQRFQISLSLRTIFECPTIESLAQSINKAPREILPDRPQLVRRTRRQPHPII